MHDEICTLEKVLGRHGMLVTHCAAQFYNPRAPTESGACFANNYLTATDRRASPLLSNNPFRSRIASGPTSPASETQSSARPVSNNPFLDATELAASPPTTELVMNGQNGRMSPPKATMSEHTKELFVSCTSFCCCRKLRVVFLVKVSTIPIA